MSTVIGLAGSLAATSRSTALVAYLLELLHAREVPGELIQLSELPADALLGRGHEPLVDAALVAEARLLVVGTPIYRASYTGQLKAFFDLLPRAALSGCAVGLIATGGIRDHALAVDHALRPLVASLEGLSAAHAVYATDADLETFPSGPLPPTVEEQLRALADELQAHARA
jgi:FMN reductase